SPLLAHCEPLKRGKSLEIRASGGAKRPARMSNKCPLHRKHCARPTLSFDLAGKISDSCQLSTERPLSAESTSRAGVLTCRDGATTQSCPSIQDGRYCSPDKGRHFWSPFDFAGNKSDLCQLSTQNVTKP